MGIVRLAGNAADSGSVANGATGIGSFYAGAGYSTFATSGDQIGVTPLTNFSGLGASSLTSGFAAGATSLNSFGYGNAPGQYGADQLSFALSQGDYTASGATLQTFQQNQLNSAPSFSQFSVNNQTLFSTINLQANAFVTSFQPTTIISAGYLSAGSNLGIGLGTGIGASGVLSSFPTSLVPLNNTAALEPGLVTDGVTGTLNSNPTETAAGLGVTGLGVTGLGVTGLGVTGSGVSAIGSVGATTSQALGSGLDATAANALGAAHSPAGLGTGSVDAASSLPNVETANSGGATPGETLLGNNGQAMQGQGIPLLITAGNSLLTKDQISINGLNTDPFAHYSELIQSHQDTQGAPGLELYTNNTQDAVKLATAVGTDHLVFSDHVVSPLASHSGQTGDVHVDPVSYALQHAADAGGHLL